jgi:hypothetical protein
MDFDVLAPEYVIEGVHSLGFDTTLRLRAGAGTVGSGEYCGVTTGLGIGLLVLVAQLYGAGQSGTRDWCFL